MKTWTLTDIPWESFEKTKVDLDILLVVKAASVVEYNANDYRCYLNNVFKDDYRLCLAIDQWSIEEVQHGEALGRWAALADPSFDFKASFKRFVDNFEFPLDVSLSTRGSRTGELIARCMVETGTNSFYNALADATEEPVLKEICRRIAEDEYAHYCLFQSYMKRYLKKEDLTLFEKLRVAFSRIAETEDEELATAFWAANRPGEVFDRRSNSVSYALATLKYYQSKHVARGIEMIFGALNLNASGLLGWFAVRAAGAFIWYRGRLCPRIKKGYVQLFSDCVPLSDLSTSYDPINEANSSRTSR
ncbi:MAG: ferritin-like domain-containing protein [Pseudomonadota bacterium]|nr:ferritin-like domain-containing protein [Pseudomonadota bacterium]